MGKMRQFRRAIRGCVGRPLLYHARDGYGAVLFGLLERVARGQRVHDGEIHDVMAGYESDVDGGPEPKRAALASGPTMFPAGKDGKVTAVVPMRGVAMYDLEFQPYCFSTLLLAQTMSQLANDPMVGTIMMDIDSPGGMVTGTAEAADAIYAAAKRKNVVAMVNPLCASAAYWLASQAGEILAIKSADIGSIGVFMAHTDCSKFNEMQGMKVTYIYAGEYKVEGNSDEPLSDEAKAHYQSEVDDIHQQFMKAVARGRGTSMDDVHENFGKGRCMPATAAKKCGMIDDIMKLDQAMARCGIAAMSSMSGRRNESEQPEFASAEGREAVAPVLVDEETADGPARELADGHSDLPPTAEQPEGQMPEDEDDGKKKKKKKKKNKEDDHHDPDHPDDEHKDDEHDDDHDDEHDAAAGDVGHTGAATSVIDPAGVSADDARRARRHRLALLSA